jgi:hypothetical protein
LSTIPAFQGILNVNASAARYFRSSGRSVPCPCQTPEGFRDPELHLSFPKYGPKDFTVGAGPIPAGTEIQYSIFAFGSGAALMSPAISFDIGNPSPDDAFSILFSMGIPPIEIQSWAIYRYENGDGPYFLGSVVNQAFNDIYPLHTGQPPMTNVPVPVICNEAGMLTLNPLDFMVKAFVQPIQSTRATRLSTEYIQEIFGVVEADDHLGIFPVNWSGKRLDFDQWSQSGEDFIEYNGSRFFVVNANMIPDPGDGNPEHHWELGLRMIREDGLAG